MATAERPILVSAEVLRVTVREVAEELFRPHIEEMIRERLEEIIADTKEQTKREIAAKLGLL
jgi:hypothetical protein